MYGCQQNRVRYSSDLIPILEYICRIANNLTNCGIYLARQTFFKENRIVGKFDLEKFLKQQENYQALYSQCSQQTLRSVAESFKSFKELRKCFFNGEIDKHPKLPTYREKGGLAVATYPKQALRLKDNQVRAPNKLNRLKT